MLDFRILKFKYLVKVETENKNRNRHIPKLLLQDIKVDLVFFVQIEEWSFANILASVLERISNDENQIVQ